MPVMTMMIDGYDSLRGTTTTILERPTSSWPTVVGLLMVMMTIMTGPRGTSTSELEGLTAILQMVSLLMIMATTTIVMMMTGTSDRTTPTLEGPTAT